MDSEKAMQNLGASSSLQQGDCAPASAAVDVLYVNGAREGYRWPAEIEVREIDNRLFVRIEEPNGELTFRHFDCIREMRYLDAVAAGEPSR